jgi:hypothetical protein
MPKVLYDAEGNEVQVQTDEEIQQITKEKDDKIADLGTKLQKLENKDFNFKKYRDMTEEERGKLTEMEKSIKQQQEKLEEDQKAFVESQVTEHKNYAFSTLAGDDKELRAKIELHFNRIDPGKPATTQTAIMERAREAYVLATGGSAAPVSSLGSVMGLSGSGGQQKPKEGELTADQKDLAKKLGLTDADLLKDASHVIRK